MGGRNDKPEPMVSQSVEHGVGGKPLVRPTRLHYREKLIIFSLGFRDSTSVLFNLPRDILRAIVSQYREVGWSEEKSSNVFIQRNLVTKPGGEKLTSYAWNSFAVAAESEAPLYFVQLQSQMQTSEYQSPCVMIGLAEEKALSPSKSELYDKGGWYSMFWQFKCYQYSPSGRGVQVTSAKVEDYSVITVEYQRDSKQIIFWGCSIQEYELGTFRKHNNGTFKDVSFTSPYYLVVLFWKADDTVELLNSR